MNNKEILANAPDGATHVGVDGAYIIYRGAGIYEYKFEEADSWERVDCMLTTRKLSDIKLIVELENAMRTLLSNSSLVVNFPTECEMLENVLRGDL